MSYTTRTIVHDIPFLPEPTAYTESDQPSAVSGQPVAGAESRELKAERLPFARALKIATQIRNILAPYCAPGKCVIAGSIRRQLEFVGDIDIVCEPLDWMGQHHQALRDRVKAKTTLVTDGLQILIVRLQDGTQLDVYMARPRYRELFETKPGNFGSVLLCRTGSAAHNIKLVERAKQLNLRWQPAEGVYRGHALIASESEEQIFAALNLPYIEPKDRL